MEKIALPETLGNETITLQRHNHIFDEQLFNAIDANRTHLRPWLFWVDKTNTLEDTKKTTDLFINLWQEKSNFAYVILNKQNEVLGTIDFHDVNIDNRSGEIGYWLRKDKTGYGYISMALKLLEDEIFNLGFVRIAITCDSLNTASSAVAIRNSYSYEGCCKKALNAYGELHDRLLYAKINPLTSIS